MSATTKLSIPAAAVGRYVNAEGTAIPLPFSIEEKERARIAANRILSSFHFRTGSNILLTALLHDCAQLLPIERAIMSYGMVTVSADSSPFDAKRVESIARVFTLAGAMNITPETLTGLEQLGHDPEALFANMPIWAQPGAYEQLKKSPDLEVYRIIILGPAVAIECSAGNGAHIDRREWLAEEDDGEIIITSLLSRSLAFEHYHTGVKGRLIHDACQCGNVDPRIELTD